MKKLQSVFAIMLLAVVAFSLSLPGADETYAASSKPAKVVIKSAVSTDYNAVKITWKKAKNAKKYQVYRATSKNGKYKLIKTTTERSFTNKKLTTGKKYYFKVRAINGKKKGSFSAKKAVTPKLKKVVVKTITSTASTIKLTYKKVNGAKKYQIYRATAKNGKYKLVGTTTKLSFTNKILTSEKKYFYKIRAVRSVNGKNKYGAFSSVKVIKTKKKTTVSNPAPGDSEQSLDTIKREVLTLVNKERAKAGAAPLQSHVMIEKTAQEKAVDMKTTGVFDHYSKNLGHTWDQYEKCGLRYLAAGENIAWGQRNAEEVMDSWMNSSGHRSNILSKDFTHIGIGYADGYWVQQFAGIDPESTIETCRYCKKQFTSDRGNRYNSTDAEGNIYYILQCPHCIQLMEKCPKCETGYFETVGLTQWGSQAEKCDVCGHLQDATCIDACPTCNNQIWDKGTDKSNTNEVDYTVTFDSTQSYDGKNYNRVDGCYFQQFVVSSNICKKCGTHVLMDASTIRDYQEFYQLLEETLGAEDNIFDYIKWEKQVDLVYKGENGSWTEYEIVKEFVRTPAITDLAQLVGMTELQLIK